MNDRDDGNLPALIAGMVIGGTIGCAVWVILLVVFG